MEKTIETGKDAFFEGRIVTLFDEVNDASAGYIIKQLLVLDSMSNDPITLYINSPGGSVSAGLAIYDTIQHITSVVSTVGVGMCASMGALLLCSGAPGKRFVLPHTQVIIHQPLGGVSGQATEIQIACERILETKKRINQIMAAHTGQTVKRISADTERDKCMWAEDAVAYGLVDAIKTPGAK